MATKLFTAGNPVNFEAYDEVEEITDRIDILIKHSEDLIKELHKRSPKNMNWADIVADNGGARQLVNGWDYDQYLGDSGDQKETDEMEHFVDFVEDYETETDFVLELDMDELKKAYSILKDLPQ